MASITVHFPESAEVPSKLKGEPERALYLIVGALYTQHEISAEEAQRLTGDEPEVFEEKLMRYGFGKPWGPARASTAGASGSPSAQTRWKALASSLEEEGFLDGRSDEAQRLLAESRLAF